MQLLQVMSNGQNFSKHAENLALANPRRLTRPWNAKRCVLKKKNVPW